jgi:hypothetical protein
MGGRWNMPIQEIPFLPNSIPILAGWVNPFYMVRYTFISTTHRNPSDRFGIYNSVIFLVLFVHRVT